MLERYVFGEGRNFVAHVAPLASPRPGQDGGVDEHSMRSGKSRIVGVARDEDLAVVRGDCGRDLLARILRKWMASCFPENMGPPLPEN